ncbi:carbamoyltransferase [Achromobacter denitrificans]|uniref:carbamoyltransferase family protein n=1 Tax=Achromobacter denitrificans TaxID=32002 RepID=UPI000B4D2A2E|nr:carbamoyltransferase C-terminal domain-containing protein [Achromobacter denitrificans]ASC66435.1 carbamoyltransferase [Achromobacter denitrificans]QCS64704.1 carbamoyltransferase [Achromobacter denitrificans]
MFTLGINAAYHDCAAALVRDGVVVAAAEEERFTRVKHGKRPVPFTTWQLPYYAIDHCLSAADIRLRDVDHIVYSYDPSLLAEGLPPSADISLPLEPSRAGVQEEGKSPWDPLFLSYLMNAPRQLLDGAPHHLKSPRFDDLTLEHIMDRWVYLDHHLSHEASAFLAAPCAECAVLTMDGRGERTTTSFGNFSSGEYARLKQIDLPHSLGLLYEDVTRYLGFLHSSDEYKVMALASYGKPAFRNEFREILRLEEDGGYSLRPTRLAERFGPPRKRGAPFDDRHKNIASSLQYVLEETALHMVQWLHEKTGAPNLSMAGGVALNCVMNARIARDGPFDSVWVQPAAGDAGTSLGAALYVDYHRRGGKREWAMEHAYLGPSYSDDEIERFLYASRLDFRRLDDVAGEAAALLAQDKILGWFQGRMEFGPRALGARSILASPLDSAMQARLNGLKDREDFRPVAPVVMEERAAEWFDGRGASICAPFMLFVYDVLANRAQQIPAVRHIDGTARVQTVRRDQNPRYYDLLAAFERITGVPVLVNTSFNTRGEPVVCSPRDAVECFWTSPLDALVIGPYLIEKPR